MTTRDDHRMKSFACTAISPAAPCIEDGVYVGAGAKILGGITVGRGATIGANAVVTKNVPAGATVVGANRILEKPSLYALEKKT